MDWMDEWTGIRVRWEKCTYGYTDVLDGLNG
jgi:hypothetical protein